MPNLRRQPNPSGQLDEARAGNLRAQFQTPPSRRTPSNPTRAAPPSTGPHEITPDALPAMAPPAGIINPFGIFGRGTRHDPQAPPPQEYGEDEGEDEDVFDDADEDFDPHAQDVNQDEYEDELDSDEHPGSEELEDTEDVDPAELDEMMDDQLEEDDEDMDRERSESPLPSNLREISSLASWTVSTSKPGCGVAALRNPSPMQYWQSDGPQPHILTLHFFKLVAVVRIRVYLDFNMDESYTPTKMIFLAGMGGNDLVEFATWEGEAPRGWEDIPLEGVGGRNGGWVHEDKTRPRRRSSHAEGEDSDDGDSELEERLRQEPYYGNVLKAMVIQMRVMENHQNGKDTHVRGFQVFASDGSRATMTAPSASADGRDRLRRHSHRQSLRPNSHHDRVGSVDLDVARLDLQAVRPVSPSGLEEPEWMGEPIIR
ncbi:hypothetical protein N7468_007503 [Penicillium chermesinum]|uniref:DOC domain-containing protein n=1 Tax=Penicillium chermesinum TaxID=63820 RepID=A0A9W9TKQ5_9EURO|nr:uncharacterized protein N7468_007503 [Penicillium chermesinum]KAJ5226278.1 hypothetical protein N7468_007503 [Penicillium chermesinum]